MMLIESMYDQLCIKEDYLNDDLEIFRKKLSPLVSESEILMLQENKVSDLFKNLWEKLKLLWSKFINKLDNVFRSNESWFNKYEKMILNADLKDFEWNMIPYWNGTAALEKCKIFAFNPLDKNQLEYCATEEAYKEKIKQTYFPTEKELTTGSDFITGLEYLFRGGEVTLMKGAEIERHLKTAISYCKGFKDIYNKVNADYKNIEKCVNYAKTHATRASNKNDESVKSESVMLHEENDKLDNTTLEKMKNQKSILDAKNKELLKKQKENMSNSIDTTNKDKRDFNDEDIKEKNLTKKQGEDRLNAYENYITVSQQVLVAKMNILQERYDLYMKLFKAIVDVALRQKTVDSGTVDKNRLKGKDYYEAEVKEAMKLLNKEKSNTKGAEKRSIEATINKFKSMIDKMRKSSRNENERIKTEAIDYMRTNHPDIYEKFMNSRKKEE